MNSLDKMEEDKMREAFAKWKTTEEALQSVCQLTTAGFEYAIWKAAIAHANTHNSKLIEDYDRLAKLMEKLAEEIEQLRQDLNDARNGWESAVAENNDEAEEIVKLHNAHVELERSYIERLSAATATIAMQAEALKAVMRLDSYFNEHAGLVGIVKTAIHASAEFVAAWEAEHAAKVRNECIQEIEMLRIAHDPRMVVPGDEYYAKAISTLRATNKVPK